MEIKPDPLGTPKTAQMNHLLFKVQDTTTESPVTPATGREAAGKLAQPEAQVSPELNLAELTPGQAKELEDYLRVDRELHGS
jgi:hypothetical protein